MTTIPAEAEAARVTILGLLNGGAELLPLDDYGRWAEVVTCIADARATGGPSAARATCDALTRADRRVAQLLAAGHTETHEAALPAGCPPLPEAARAVLAHAEPCGHWLDEYIAFASEAAPMTPRSFHEAAGLFAVAVAVARRCVLRIGDHEALYPNLYALFLAPSTIYHKSSGLRLVDRLLQSAELTHLLLPRKGTPEALVADLDPFKLPGAKTRDMDLHLTRRAFAAQRGYLRDEVSSLFASFKREFNAGLLELILDLYDSPSYYDEVTISRGETVIRDACLSFFGASTPIEMGTHLADSSLWSNGLWARFALIVPDGPPTYSFHRPAVAGLDPLARELRRIYDLFPARRAEFIPGKADDPDPLNKADHIELTPPAPPSPVVLAPGVWQAWEAYSRAMHELLHPRYGLDQELNANYGRFGTKVIKTAMLLAVMDTQSLPVVVTLTHFARAQQIVEGWRASLHRVWTSNAETTEARLSRRISERLKQTKAGMTCHQLTRLLRSSTKETREALDTLAKAGQVIGTETHGANGRKVEVWQWASQD